MLCHQPPLIATRCRLTMRRGDRSNRRFHGALLRAALRPSSNLGREAARNDKLILDARPPTACWLRVAIIGTSAQPVGSSHIMVPQFDCNQKEVGTVRD